MARRSKKIARKNLKILPFSIDKNIVLWYNAVFEFRGKRTKNKNISIYLLTKQNTYDIMLIQSKEER